MRYLPLTDAERAEMLDIIGVDHIDALFSDIPQTAIVEDGFSLSDHMSEMEVESIFKSMASRNLSPSQVPCFLGGGAYRHHIPASVDHLIQRGEFLTSYTPYQPEISQGTLQTLFEFQTQVALATEMDVANASMYDGATACAEAILMARRVTRRSKVLISGTLHPHYCDVARTTGQYLGIEYHVETTDPGAEAAAELDKITTSIDDNTACVVVQNPDVFGRIADLTPLADACHACGALLIVTVTEFVSLGAIVPPGAQGADIVAAEGQSLGNALSFGGPYLGLFASRQGFVRQMPGRLCGEAYDAVGYRSYTLTLSTREQHIRREKATSNICTNSGLCALAFSIHMTLLGETGFRDLALANHSQAMKAVDCLSSIPNVEVVTPKYFNEVTLRCPIPADEIVDAAAEAGVLAGVPLQRLFPERQDFMNLLLVAITECVTEEDIDRLANVLEDVT